MGIAIGGKSVMDEETKDHGAEEQIREDKPDYDSNAPNLMGGTSLSEKEIGMTECPQCRLMLPFDGVFPKGDTRGAARRVEKRLKIELKDSHNKAGRDRKIDEIWKEEFGEKLI